MANDFSTNHQQYPYRVYEIKTRYVWDNGTLDMPVGYVTNTPTVQQDATQLAQSARQPAEEIQVAAPKGRKIVTFYIERYQQPPIAPAPDPVISNEKLLSAVVEEYAPIVLPDGSNYLYKVSGTYIFSLQRPQWYKDGFRKGATDVDTSQASANVSSLGEFKDGYL